MFGESLHSKVTKNDRVKKTEEQMWDYLKQNLRIVWSKNQSPSILLILPFIFLQMIISFKLYLWAKVSVYYNYKCRPV